jgi:hypothetical protein
MDKWWIKIPRSVLDRIRAEETFSWCSLSLRPSSWTSNNLPRLDFRGDYSHRVLSRGVVALVQN